MCVGEGNMCGKGQWGGGPSWGAAGHPPLHTCHLFPLRWNNHSSHFKGRIRDLLVVQGFRLHTSAADLTSGWGTKIPPAMHAASPPKKVESARFIGVDFGCHLTITEHSGASTEWVPGKCQLSHWRHGQLPVGTSERPCRPHAAPSCARDKAEDPRCPLGTGHFLMLCLRERVCFFWLSVSRR